MTAPTPAPRKTKDPLSALVAGVEQMLSELDDDAWQQLVARVRPPADTEPKTTEPKTAATDYPESWGYGAKGTK
ncbi:hypothetical protein [Gordonia alkanivorans]|uniref:hypothetical protein n=1 Tax=Gordonia alkanivorans TaxID=84096 RepID=UPI002449ABC8|nr:hypothetical protein [Gordonia alkanivorans]MDH3007093.1 hypothetical protein [Gordonia alkanivorans]MDH3015033.1 hypothetical protein [Gordonia alkanivorans]MDH3021620.1 hypothetical protein [Gordonia alkanivorans]MDH3040157.1 hypothetical protein [Gordonia alkanivorans]MDH3059415.1 hypothetical protein [Gordonia alkanivorans]